MEQQEQQSLEDFTFRNHAGDVNARFVEAVDEATAIGARDILKHLIDPLHASDVGDLLTTLHEDTAVKLIELMGADFDFEALTEVDETARVRILERLPTQTVVQGVGELDSDDAIYILEDLDSEDRDEILAQLPAIDRAVLKRSLDFPEESAGRRMKTEFVAMPPFWTVGQASDYLRTNDELPETFYEIYIIDPAYKLLGWVSLDKLLRTRRPQKLEDIMFEPEHEVLATEDQEDVARLFERYNLFSTAVVDENGCLVGVLTADDIVDVIEEEADEDLKALAGVKSDEELSDSVFYITKSRFSWLFFNLLTAILASYVISFFEDQLQKMVALAVLMPIVASQGGNAGTQTMAVAVRALATQSLSNFNASKFVFREIFVGLFNGILFAILMGIIAAVWFSQPQLGLVIGFAMLVNLIAAAAAGVLIPLALEKMDIDPAVASGTFVTTVTDVVGFFAFLGFASWWFVLG